MEILNQIWLAIAPYVTGISISGLLGAIIYGSLKGAFARTINTLNVEKISNDAVGKGIERIKEVSFTQSIQPIVESELVKITENANKYIESKTNEMNENYAKLLNVLIKLSAYFDNSIGVSDEAKTELRLAIKEAEKTETTIVDIGNIEIEDAKKMLSKYAEEDLKGIVKEYKVDVER